MAPEAPVECLYLVRDAFGEQYAEAYGIPESSRVTMTTVPGDAELPRAGMLVALHAGRDEALRDALDRIGFERNIPSVGVELLPTRIICGPAVIPGATACYSCYLARIEQHRDPAQPYDVGRATRGLDEGFGPQHLAIAHGLLALAVDELRTGPQGLGATVRTFDLVAGTLATAETVAVDRCPRCGVRFRDRPTSGAGAVAGLP
ncbi:TOMM precursor leader peptide-binding protein [Streptomyces sp. NPDC005202]|uniref:TOMM precursor leader peptide-binding protein n=1 Tax=Streptomyces sp. NPDC005202 TaxID=3157021 RepID=UPI0033ACD5CC